MTNGKVCAAALLAAVSAACAGDAPTIFTIAPQPTAPVRSELFGQFLERASFGEPGPEAFADPVTGALPEPILAALAEMGAPVIRFPGGTDVDFLDWRDLIDGVPGRSGPRPVSVRSTTNRDAAAAGSITNRFGWEEYFSVQRRLGNRTIAVLNVMDALLRTKPLDDAVRDAVGLLAYCNAPMGAALPLGMPDWPAVRARNGHPHPHRVEYVQIGNEWTFKTNDIRKAISGDDLAGWYLRVLHAYLEAIRTIDPDVRILIDATNHPEVEAAVLGDERLRRSVAGAAIHTYAPGSLDVVRRQPAPPTVDAATLSAEDWWYGTCFLPAGLAPDGTALGVRGASYDRAVALGYPIVVTEWNWNGWGWKNTPEPFRSEWVHSAQAVGTASFLNGLLRQSEHVVLATQSMLLGHRWGIAAVTADPTGAKPPWFRPQALATQLYLRHHGDRRLSVAHGPLPGTTVTYITGKWTTWPQQADPFLAWLDVVATANAEHLFLHIVQRAASQSLPVAIDCSAVCAGEAAGVRIDLAHLPPEQRPAAGQQTCGFRETPVRLVEGWLRETLPPRTALVIRLPLLRTSAR